MKVAERADDAEHHGQDEAAGLVGAGRDQARQDAGDQSDEENPKHIRLLMSAGTEPAVCDAVT